MGRTSDARARLMEAAHELIWEHSYGAVTIDAICLRAGVKKCSFYYFFDSKSDLAVTAIDEWWTERKELMKEVFRPEVPPLDRLRGYLDFIIQRQVTAYEASGQVLGCPVFTLGSEIATQDEIIRLRICHCLDCLMAHIEQAISDAQAAGEIPEGDARAKAYFFMAYFEGVLTRARIEKNLESIRRLSVDALEIIGARRSLVEV